jgi:protease-4
MSDDNSEFHKTLVETLISERRSDRRWRIIRTFLWAFLVLLFFFLIYSPGVSSSDKVTDKPYVSLIRLNGVIMAGSRFSAIKVLPQLNKAFADKHSKGVLLVINSPGGSPVQATIIHDRIEYLKKRYHKKVIVLGQDVLASGAYLIATAADKIYVHKDTIAGSIGVIMSGFGFTDAIHKLGITRRVFTAGKNKDRLDPFTPVTPADKGKIRTLLGNVHKNFIQDVLAGRRGKLHGNPSELFSGDFWDGTAAVKLGIVDGTSNMWNLMQTQFNVTHYRDYSIRPTFVEAILKGAETKLNFGLESNLSPLKAILR